jgi:hypothetical protein
MVDEVQNNSSNNKMFVGVIITGYPMMEKEITKKCV